MLRTPAYDQSVVTRIAGIPDTVIGSRHELSPRVLRYGLGIAALIGTGRVPLDQRPCPAGIVRFSRLSTYPVTSCRSANSLNGIMPTVVTGFTRHVIIIVNRQWPESPSIDLQGDIPPPATAGMPQANRRTVIVDQFVEPDRRY